MVIIDTVNNHIKDIIIMVLMEQLVVTNRLIDIIKLRLVKKLKDIIIIMIMVLANFNRNMGFIIKFIMVSMELLILMEDFFQ